jgi:hypothetical protein
MLHSPCSYRQQKAYLHEWLPVIAAAEAGDFSTVAG